MLQTAWALAGSPSIESQSPTPVFQQVLPETPLGASTLPGAHRAVRETDKVVPTADVLLRAATDKIKVYDPAGTDEEMRCECWASDTTRRVGATNMTGSREGDGASVGSVASAHIGQCGCRQERPPGQQDS